ncbi:hypothetical protein L3Q82_003702 [Scortum barcoo]|uniref:Uncharacterized protein n=1 Tax=Scortum barcoo TaxID=214431 RepID=A0ACB8X633_9TELE|nr:hypothetical protein L3Q82_003702 [Scortum barcoo]
MESAQQLRISNAGLRLCSESTTSSTLTLNTGAPQGCVLSPLLYSLFHTVAPHSSNTIIRSADDTTVIRSFDHHDNERRAYREVRGQSPDILLQDNNLHLNVSKTKELIVDFRRRQREEHTPLSINGTTVERVSSFRLRRLNMDSRIPLQLLQVTHREGATGSLKIPTPSDTNWSACCHLESVWLKEILSFITEQVHPLLSGPAPTAADNQLTGGGVSPDQLSVCVVKKIQEITSVTHTLPVSYRPVSVSELLSRQHLACVSNLSWSTNQQRVWAKEAELSLPGHRALPRVNLLLIGCLREGRGGEWRLTDASGSVRCECLSPSPSWLNWPVFLPHWNYIPHDAREQDQDEAGGHVELIGSPVLLCHRSSAGIGSSSRGKGRGLAVQWA